MYNFDPLGKWTFSIGLNFSAFLFGGNSYTVYLSYDSCGNVALQTATADATRKDSGGVFGLGSVGLSVVATVTSYETVDDLEGTSIAVGGAGSAGLLCVGGECITSMELDGIDGFSIYGGVGVGYDFHITTSVTETHWKAKWPIRAVVLW